MPPTTFQVAGYPASYQTSKGNTIAIRPMVPQDRDALLEFFRLVPKEDRLFLKEDVTSPAVIQRWAEELDYGRVLPLLALSGARVVGDGTLHRSRCEAVRHVSEVRVVIDPEYRNQGIGRHLLEQLLQAALQDPKLEKVHFELVTDTQRAARHAAESLGFLPVALFRSHVRYFEGAPHDLIVLERSLTGPQISEPDPAQYMF